MVQALQLYESVNVGSPQHYSQARYRLALLALGADAPREAEAYVLEALDSDKSNGAAWREWLRYLGLTYQHAKAREAAWKSIQAGADSPATFVYLMACDLVIYREGEAKTKRWANDDPHPELFEVASFLHAVKRESLTDMPEAADASVATDTFSAVTSALDERLAALVQRYPKNLDLLFLQMERAIEAGNQAKLAQLLAKLPSSAAEDPRSWRLRGQWLQLQDRHDDATAAYRTAIQKNPYDTRPYQFLSEMARLRNDPVEASKMQEIASTGNSLRRMIYSSQSIEQLDVPIFQAMTKFAEQVQQTQVAEHLKNRLGAMTQVNGRPSNSP